MLRPGTGAPVVADRGPAWLNDTGVTDAGLKPLVRLKRLSSLGLGSTGISDRGLKDLAGLATRKSLAVPKCRVSEEAVARFLKARPDCSVYRTADSGRK